LTDLSREIILSLHLIYWQNPESRRVFSEDKAFAGVPRETRDRLLRDICGGKWTFDFPGCRPKRIYDLHNDFPILGARLQCLSEHVRLQEPKNLGQLWRDKRNTLQWWTFWAVLVFGFVTVLLAVAQTVLAALQVFYAPRALRSAT